MEPDPILVFEEAARRSPIAWAGLLAMLGAIYLVARLVAWTAVWVALRPWRRAAGEAWVERARRAWPGRRVGRVAPIVIAMILTTMLIRDGSRADLLPAVATNSLVAASAAIGALSASVAWARRLNPAWSLTPRPSRGAWVNWLSAIGPFLLLVLSEPLVAPERWGGRAWATLVGGALFLGSYLTWGRLRLLRWSGVVRPAGERFRAIATRAAERAGIELRSVEQVGLAMANAFAYIHERGIAVTDAALAVLDDDELGAVCAHELAHLGEPAWVRAARLAYAFLFGLWVSACWLFRPMIRGVDAPTVWGIILGGPVALLVVGRVFLGLVHRMEVRADAHVGPAEDSPGAYARALANIYETNLVPAVLGVKRRTHPELYDRLVAAGTTPDYPRPSDPPRGSWWGGLAVVVLGTIAGGLVLMDVVAARLPRAVLPPGAAAFWTTGAVGGALYEACALARGAADRGDVERELAFYRAAARLEPSRAFAPAMLAGRLAQLGRCREASRLWVEANTLAWSRGRDGHRFPDEVEALAWAQRYVEAACPGGAGAPAASNPDEAE